MGGCYYVLRHGLIVCWNSYSWGVIQDALASEGGGSPATRSLIGLLSTRIISVLAIIHTHLIRCLGSRRTAILGVLFLGLSALTSSAAVSNITGLVFTSVILLGFGSGNPIVPFHKATYLMVTTAAVCIL
ncbi:hypothetical protein V8C42DRAFT_66703 [Trichoderma barbatum]